MMKPDREHVGRQAPNEVWTHEERLTALRSGTDEDRLQALKDAGILDENGKLTPLYAEDWGEKASRADPDLYL